MLRPLRFPSTSKNVRNSMRDHTNSPALKSGDGRVNYKLRIGVTYIRKIKVRKTRIRRKKSLGARAMLYPLRSSFTEKTAANIHHYYTNSMTSKKEHFNKKINVNHRTNRGNNTTNMVIYHKFPGK